jgi:hypothetical protein
MDTHMLQPIHESEIIEKTQQKEQKETEQNISTINYIIESSETNNIINTECQELKTLKYKTMLLNGNTVSKETRSSDTFEQLQKFLDEEKNKNKQETWSKLSKSIKYKKLTEYVKNYSQINELDEDSSNGLMSFLKESIDRGKLLKNKEVTYDKTKGAIKELPGLLYNKSTKHFTLKNFDQKHMTTLKNIPSTFKPN